MTRKQEFAAGPESQVQIGGNSARAWYVGGLNQTS